MITYNHALRTHGKLDTTAEIDGTIVGLMTQDICDQLTLTAAMAYAERMLERPYAAALGGTK